MKKRSLLMIAKVASENIKITKTFALVGKIAEGGDRSKKKFPLFEPIFAIYPPTVILIKVNGHTWINGIHPLTNTREVAR